MSTNADEHTEEDENDGNDSTYGGDESASNASTSIRSDITRYVWKHGRRYHSYQAGAYSFPNDDREQDRLDLVHHAISLLLDDRLFLAPIQPDGLKILDVGTGTGIWAIQMGDKYPSATIIGNDLSPIQPSWVPNNVKFIVDDVELDWSQPSCYDYIHLRYLAGSIKDWPRLMRQAFASLKPGGWIELQEASATFVSENMEQHPVDGDNALVQLMDTLDEACQQTGRTIDPAPHLSTWTRDVGFDTVHRQIFKIPVGTWPKERRLRDIGAMMSVNYFDGVEGFTAILAKDVLGWPEEEVEMLNARVRTASRDREAQIMFDYVVVTAQKPQV